MELECDPTQNYIDKTINPNPKFCTQFSPFTAFRTEYTDSPSFFPLPQLSVFSALTVCALKYSGYQIGDQLNNYYWFPSSRYSSRFPTLRSILDKWVQKI